MFKPLENFLRKRKLKKLDTSSLLEKWPEIKRRRLEKAKKELSWHKKQASSAVEELESHAAKLKEAEIAPENIGGAVASYRKVPGLPSSPDRIMKLARGNKERYIVVLDPFISWLKDWWTRIDDVDAHACLRFNERLNKFGQKTQKNYAIISEVIGERAVNVMESLKQISSRNKKIEGVLDKVKILELNKIDNALSELEELKNKISRLKEEQKSLGADAVRVKKKLEDKTKELELARKNKKVSELERATAERKLAAQDVDTRKREIRVFFTKHERALKKYMHGAPTGLENYLREPVAALESDKDLKIIGLFSEIKENIEDIKVSEKRKNRIKNLDVDQIKNLRENLVAARRKLDELKKQESGVKNSKPIKQLKALERGIEEEKNKTKRLATNRSKLANKVGKAEDLLASKKEETGSKIRDFL